MRKKRNDFDAVGVERMTDAELSKKLGGYQRTESISISLGVLLVIAGCISTVSYTHLGQIAPQDDPNEGLGGGLSEDTVNDFSGFEGIWLGEANNDYDSMEFDAEGNWTLYLSGEVMDDGYLRYEPEWEAIPLKLMLRERRLNWRGRSTVSPANAPRSGR